MKCLNVGLFHFWPQPVGNLKHRIIFLTSYILSSTIHNRTKTCSRAFPRDLCLPLGIPSDVIYETELRMTSYNILNKPTNLWLRKFKSCQWEKDRWLLGFQSSFTIEFSKMKNVEKESFENTLLTIIISNLASNCFWIM